MRALIVFKKTPNTLDKESRVFSIYAYDYQSFKGSSFFTTDASSALMLSIGEPDLYNETG